MIPTIEDSRLYSLAGCIKPARRSFLVGRYHEVLSTCMPNNRAGLQKPIGTKAQKFTRPMATLAECTTAHPPGLFEPTLEEVFAQVQNHPACEEATHVSIQYSDRLLDGTYLATTTLLKVV